MNRRWQSWKSGVCVAIVPGLLWSACTHDAAAPAAPFAQPTSTPAAAPPVAQSPTAPAEAVPEGLKVKALEDPSASRSKGKRHKGDGASSLYGIGVGGSGTGEGTIGLGQLGTIGKGGGGGSGSGYGRGAGGLAGRSSSGAAYGATIAWRSPPGVASNTEAYAHEDENAFRTVKVAPLSTFSVDVDTASYSNMRRFLHDGQLPPIDAVRVEELVNYFPYNYQPPTGTEPFSANTEIASCPWAPTHRLMRVGIKARDIDVKQRPASSLTFLIDVSGSMQPDNRLPLLKRALPLLVDRLDARDHVAIVVYAGSSGMVLAPTRGDQRTEILAALEHLEAGGSTNGAAGLELAYKLARQSFVQGGSNRVILATDGDFNVGTTSEGALVRLIEEQAKHGVHLSVLGFGKGNYKDSMMEKLADKGNGNYAYIDTLQEARKVLVEQMTGTLITVAKDVKLQIEFNPARVEAYRQIGYEDRQLRNEDFNNDKIDAGDIGAGHTVTALYEIVPAGVATKLPTVDPLKYQTAPQPAQAGSDELATVKIRYKPPTGDKSTLSSFPVADSARAWQEASVDWKLAAGVAELGMLLRGSKNKGTSSYATAAALAHAGRGDDAHGHRAELEKLIATAEQLSAKLARR